MEKRERLEQYLEEDGLDAVWFARPNSFAWLTGGSNVVDRESDVGIAAIGYERGESRLRLVTNNIEADRLVAEEVPELDVALDADVNENGNGNENENENENEDVDTETDLVVERDPWHDSTVPSQIAARVAEDERAAADVDIPGLETIDPSRLRQPLTDRDIERYRNLGRETARAVESVCRELQPRDTEHEVASALRVALSARGIEAPVVLVGGSKRAQQYRHYTPTQAELGEYALVSVTAERAGLHASCTRTVAFDPPEWLEQHHEAAARVEATALAATRAVAAVDAGESDDGSGGEATAETPATAGDVFAAIQDAYEAVGHPEEWEHHHQGGAAGFDGREWVATPGSDEPVDAPMAYAWNPTVQGAKSEDTVLVTAEGGSESENETATADDYESLTTTDDWPTITVDAVELECVGDIELEDPLVLEIERPGILELEG
ncbi:M24 family metallopeptidase [Halobiforma nitratireducens]|nr:M24 family metallopeptidase [Halobiforma nitratireducens]